MTDNDDTDFEWISKGETRQEYYGRKLHEMLQTVDYSQDWFNEESQFVAEMTFTILDWQIIERMTNTFEAGFTIDSIDSKRILQLSFNILPGVTTVVHKLVEEQSTDLIGLFQHVN